MSPFSKTPPRPNSTEIASSPTTPKRRSRIPFRSASEDTTPKDAAAAPASPPTPTPSKRPLSISGVANIFVAMRRHSESAKASTRKDWHIFSTSGSEPQSHPGMLEAAGEERSLLAHKDVFVCSEAVNLAQLLRATRNTLLEDAEFMGANALVDERWEATICGPKNRRNGFFKVEISYSASATRSERADPHRPVALDQVKGVPGLMTVLKRTP
ncbi:hypothetical protein MKEN_00697500 [Mycena kentingensis (nom. inval.)]|nr:hypothetical protein MKEN_00697500 [Mycena kentingensis (nom. inval.)]